MTKRLLPAAALVAALAVAVPALAATRSHSTPIAAKLAKQIRALKRHAHPPILVPTRSNAAVVRAKRLFGSGGRIGKGYDLELGIGKRCNGTHFCQQGTFVALRHTKLEGGRKVRLHGGSVGRYLGVRCGASCSAPRIEFKRKGVLYDIEWVVPDHRRPMKVLVALANSALRAGPR